MTRRLLLAALSSAIVVACSGPVGDPTAAPSPTTTPVELTIFAAASLKGPLDEAKTVYASAFPGTTLTISTDSSAALAAKIEQGAPADVFLSADTTNAARLVAAGLADNPVAFAGNELVIIVPKGNPADVHGPLDLAKRGLKVVAAGDEVPIANYATELLRNLAALPDAPAGFEAAYAANVVSREENVKAVVAKIELGEGDAAIVYVTDANASGKVDTVPIAPATANVLAAYAGVVIKASDNQPDATAFLAWLAGARGQGILASFGFLPPPA